MTTLTLDLRTANSVTTSISLVPQPKTLWRHFNDRISTVEGMFDALKLGEFATQWFSKLPNSSPHFGSASKFFFKAATLINMWELVKTVEKTANSVSLLAERVFAKAMNPSRKDIEVSSVAKGTARNVLDLVNMTTDTANNFQEAGWVDLGKMSPVTHGIFFGTDIIGNGLDLKNQVEEVYSRANERATNAVSSLRIAKLHHKDVHSYIQIFKNAVCITGSVIGLVSLIAGGPIVLPIVGLALSSMWIVSKIVAHFYKEIMVKDESISMQLKIKQ